MAMHFQPVLAAFDISTIVFIILVVASIIGSLTKNTQKKKSKTRKRAAPDNAASPDTMPSLEEMAAQRRDQLQALAKQRGGGSRTVKQGGRSASTSKSRMGGLAKNLADTGPSLPRTTDTQRRGEVARRHAAEAAQNRAAQAQKQRRQAESARRQRSTKQAQTRSQTKRPAQSSIKPLESRLSSPPEDRLGRGVLDIHAEHEIEQSNVHRHVPDAPTAGADRSVMQPMVLMMDKQSLRQAFILKELLDPPIALRQDQDSPFG